MRAVTKVQPSPRSFRAAALPQEPILVDPFFEYDCTQEVGDGVLVDIKLFQGVFFNPEDCGSYVTCNAGSDGELQVNLQSFSKGQLPPQSHKVSCAPNLLFNAELKVCDWPENVPDCSIR